MTSRTQNYTKLYYVIKTSLERRSAVMSCKELNYVLQEVTNTLLVTNCDITNPRVSTQTRYTVRQYSDSF